MVDKDHGGKVSLAECSHNKTNPTHQQFFTLRHFRDIMIHGKSDCLEGSSHGLNHARCHYEQGNQYFRYNLDTHQIHWGRLRNNLCIDAHEDSDYVFINFCDKSKETQKWIWGFARMSALKNWINFGEPIIDKQEIKDLLENPNDLKVELPKNSSVVHGKSPKHDKSDETAGKTKHHRARQIKLDAIPIKSLNSTDHFALPVHQPHPVKPLTAKLPKQDAIPLKLLPAKDSQRHQAQAPVNLQKPPTPKSDPHPGKSNLNPTAKPNATTHRDVDQTTAVNKKLPYQALPSPQAAPQHPVPPNNKTIKHQPQAAEHLPASQKLTESRLNPSLKPTVHQVPSQKLTTPPIKQQTAPQKPIENHDAPRMNAQQSHEPHKPVA